MKQLILGGVRSGKSRLAESIAVSSGLDVIYIATARAEDNEMQARIEHHRQQRPSHWQLVEQPIHLAQTLQQHAGDNRLLLVDCLTLWLTNLLCNDDDKLFQNERNELIRTVSTIPGHLVMVSNETGMGIVPMGELTRRFCDEAGRLHQQLASICDRVTLTIAGLPHVLKEKQINE